jgi:hypothetical protein
MRAETRGAGAGPLGRLKTPELLRPVGRSRWGMAAALAAALGLILLVPAVCGHSELGSAMALGFVLTAVPSLPDSWRAAMATMSVRALTVVGCGALVVFSAGHPTVLGVLTVAAAVLGALVQRVGATAGLAVVLIAIDVGADAGVRPPLSTLLTYAAGAAAVFVAWSAWHLGAAAVRAPGHRPAAPEPAAHRDGVAYAHAARVGVAVAAAVALVGLLPAGMVGGHWLITSVLLTIQPRQADTSVRLAQRLSGNAVGAVIAAVLLGTHPSAPVVIVATVGLFLLAVALRPVNYSWWAVTGPPVLLVVSEYPQLFPWYEGGVRLAMNFAGAAIVAVVVFAVPAVLVRYRKRELSDSVSKIQRKETR